MINSSTESFIEVYCTLLNFK